MTRAEALKWVEVDDICTRAKAPADGGHYTIVEFDADTDGAHFSVNFDMGGFLNFAFILDRDPNFPEYSCPKHFPDMKSAMEAAQADFESLTPLKHRVR